MKIWGGKFGNFHIAIGRSYTDTYSGNLKKMRRQDFENLGFNFSAIHTDIISTADRTVYAYMTDGTKLEIYKDGTFVI